MTSKEYWDEFDKTLEDEEKDFLKKNKEDINRMVRQYGRGYIEEIITIRRLQKEETLMEDTRKYIVEVFKHIIQIIDNYSEATGKSKWDVIVDGKIVKGTYATFLLGRTTIKDTFTEIQINNMKITNYMNITLNELMGYIYIFNFILNQLQLSSITHNEAMIMNNIILNYDGINIFYKLFLKDMINLNYGEPYEVVVKKNTYIPIFVMPYRLSCLMNKHLMQRVEHLNDCVCSSTNKQRNEYSPLYRQYEFEYQISNKKYREYSTGRTKVIPTIVNDYYTSIIQSNKIFMGGRSGTSLILSYMLLMFNINNQTVEQQEIYSIIAILNYLCNPHHAYHEIFSGISMGIFPHKTHGKITHILKYDIKEHYSDTITSLKQIIGDR